MKFDQKLYTMTVLLSDMENSKTTRQEIIELLSYSHTGLTPDTIASKMSTKENIISESEIIEHVKHIRKSLDNEERVLRGQPPKCQECDFEDFNTVINIPSKCPKCRSRRILEPKFKIVDTS